MDDNEHDSQIEKIALLIEQDKVSLDEHDDNKLQKYYDFAKTHFSIEGKKAKQLVNEAFLYLKLKNTNDFDLLQRGDEFGAGFS